MVKKILNCLRATVVLLAITVGFVISMSQKPAVTLLQTPPNLEEINTKLDRILEEARVRDTVLLQQILKMQQQGNQASPNGRIAEVLKD
jgi:hypothetical protein